MFKDNREAYNFLANILETAAVTRNESQGLKALFQNIDSLIKDPMKTIPKYHSDQLVSLIQATDNIVASMTLLVRQHDLASTAIQLFHHLATSRIKEETPELEPPTDLEGPTYSEGDEPAVTEAFKAALEKEKKLTTKPRLKPIED